MKLSSPDSLRSATKIGFKGAVPAWEVIEKIEGDKLKFLRENSVNLIAASRKVIAENKVLLAQLKDAGIRVYSYHLNHETGIDEKYFVCKEIGHVYGMYADSWEPNRPFKLSDCPEEVIQVW
jgi:hypothetical protein